MRDIIEAQIPWLAARGVRQVTALSRPLSSVHPRFRVDTDAGVFFVKRLDAEAAAGLRELTVPAAVGQAFAVAPAAVENGFAVMPWVQGRALLPALVLDMLLRRQRLVPALGGVGAWLHAFHRAGGSGLAGLELVADPVAEALRLAEPDPERARALPAVRCHNDPTLRNMVLTADGRIALVELDAAFHPAFPRRAWAEHDLGLLTLSLLSLVRVPGIGVRHIRPYLHAALSGYFRDGGYSPRRLRAVMRLHYFGWMLDRPLPAGYRGVLGRRFMAWLAHALAVGEDWLPEEQEVPR